MNKKHWNTITLDGTLGDPLLTELIDHSHRLVVKSLTRKARTELGLEDV